MGIAVWWRALALGALAVVAGGAQAAVDMDDLLPVDEAFALRVHAPDRERIEFDWTIAEGYYLYRHRMGAEAEGFPADGLQLPDGKRHVDEFFGEVETYRGRMRAALPGNAADGREQVVVRVRFQGCADAGICYPPQTREISVALPAGPTASGRAGFAALGRSLLGAGTASRGVADALRPQALPLPEAQAFGFDAIADGGDRLLLRFVPAPGYYLYRDRSGFTVRGEGITAGSPRWPAGVDHHDEHFGNVVVYFDPVEVALPLQRLHGDATTVALTATFQGCQADGICYPPMTRTVEIAVPASGTWSAPGEAMTAPPVPGDEPAPASPADDDAAGDPDNAIRETPPASTAAAAAAAAEAAGAGTVATPARAGGSLAGALLLALLGGLLLNLMPCVLPILSLKVVGLASSGGSRASARRHALWYTAGVLVAFAAVGLLALGLRATGQALGWGFQLQQPWFVAALAYLVFAVGLALSGVFTLGGSIGGVAQSLGSRTGPAGDFFTGVLACVVASPCIAPFMGGALAFAFASSGVAALGVFLALGLGLALPFLLVGFVPALADRLPRPGPWMETLKQAMAFPMYLTAVWLVWVLGRQRGVDAMALVIAGLALLALALWWFERQRWTGGRAAPALALLLALAALWPVAGVERFAPPAPADAADDSGAVAYSAERLATLRAAGTPVFVNMTADWCVTCKANERRVLSREPFRDALAATGTVYMVGDWTHTDAAITAFLDQHRAVGVPLYVAYPADGGPGEVLPTLLTESATLAAVARAAAGGAR
ncbi:protein-disulfide reductase DsbD family protein [Luteimonas sp. MHLX1A]|uniref:protein-disulfide reductase DsbD family protein n=1 Tax=Alterluteimonas muca TaxID=2878684 RepID=UPI001E397D78|nr:protein-disulfide reductase DsbD [Luteimonas sp. MHLX1A]MCD9045498.1 protein-disulfide reductase DsbD [Luteimonas sp. MHLX1A]